MGKGNYFVIEAILSYLARHLRRANVAANGDAEGVKKGFWTTGQQSHFVLEDAPKVGQTGMGGRLVVANGFGDDGKVLIQSLF